VKEEVHEKVEKKPRDAIKMHPGLSLWTIPRSSRVLLNRFDPCPDFKKDDGQTSQQEPLFHYLLLLPNRLKMIMRALKIVAGMARHPGPRKMIKITHSPFCVLS
jgi:hypothetical protein